MIGTINDGPLLTRGFYEYSYFARKGRKLADTRSYAADHGVAFPDFLNTDEGPAVTTSYEIVPPFFKTNRTVLKWFEALHMSNDSSYR